MRKIPTKFTELVRFDWFMKYMFRDKKNFDVLEGFLSELLKEDITILEILESEGNQDRKKDKFNRVDIMVKTAKDERIIVEIQNNEEFDYLQRILYGACKTITENMKRGDVYATVKKVISVSIVYFKTGQGNDYIYHGFTVFKGIHSHDELTLNEEQRAAFKKETPSQIYPEYYLIQAFSFPDLIQNGLDEWVYLFKYSQVEGHFKARGIDKAKEKLAIAKLGKRKRIEYERFEKELHDEASWNETQRLKAEFQKKREEEVRLAQERADNAEKAMRKAKREAAKVQNELLKAQAEAEKAQAEAEKAQVEAEKVKKETEVEVLKAKEEAKQEAKLQIAEVLFKNGADINLVLASTGLPTEILQALKEKIDNS